MTTHIVTITTFINHSTRELKHRCTSRDEVDRLSATLAGIAEVVKLTHHEISSAGTGHTNILFDRTADAVDASNRAALDALAALQASLRGGAR